MNVLCLYTYAAVWHFLVCQKRFRAATTSIGSVETLLCVCVRVCVPCRLAIVPICTHTCIHWLWVSSTAAAATCCCFSAFLLCFFYVSRYILCPSFSYFNCFCRFVSFISSATLHTFCISVPQNLTHCGKEAGRESERERRGRARVSKRGKSVR